jgi:hypothetical protein
LRSRILFLHCVLRISKAHFQSRKKGLENRFTAGLGGRPLLHAKFTTTAKTFRGSQGSFAYHPSASRIIHQLRVSTISSAKTKSRILKPMGSHRSSHPLLTIYVRPWDATLRKHSLLKAHKNPVSSLSPFFNRLVRQLCGTQISTYEQVSLRWFSS